MKRQYTMTYLEKSIIDISYKMQTEINKGSNVVTFAMTERVLKIGNDRYDNFYSAIVVYE